jgi:hypothetical protein
MSNVSQEDRLFLYLWEDLSEPTACKLGQRWVYAGLDAIADCNKRIRQSLGTRKDKFDEKKIRLVEIWDVSHYAQSVGQFDKKAKVDDYLRDKARLPKRKHRSEVHDIPAAEMQVLVSAFLRKAGQPLPEVQLSTKQYQVAVETIGHFLSGVKVILAELCARFGKTIWSSAVAVEMDVDLVIVTSYVTTVFTSFQNDITQFSQFAAYEHIDTRDNDYEEKVADALANGKKVFAYLSLNQSEYRQDRIDYLTGLECSKMLIVDEADFGAHQVKQALPLIDKIPQIDYIIIMTGTNSDRASTHWPVDIAMSVTYPELLIQKEIAKNAQELQN